jgi:hypothetical protein
VFCAQHAGHSIEPTVLVSDDHSASHAAHHHYSEAPPPPATGSAALRPVSHECAQPSAVINESHELSPTPVMGAAANVARITPTPTQALHSSDVDGSARSTSSNPVRITSSNLDRPVFEQPLFGSRRGLCTVVSRSHVSWAPSRSH